jgi:hypothetical protein
MSIMYFRGFKHVFFVAKVWIVRMVPAADAGYQEADDKKIADKRWESERLGGLEAIGKCRISGNRDRTLNPERLNPKP